MTKISRLKLDSQQLGFFLNNFWNLITLLEDKEQVKNFLKEVLTHTEMKMFAKRIQIARMLLEGYTYKDIRAHVKVTDSTISKINNILETGGEGIKTAIKYLQKMEEDIDKERMRAMPELKKKYPTYFLPERAFDAIDRKLKAHKKKKSVAKDVLL